MEHKNEDDDFVMYNRIKKGEIQGEECHDGTMMYSEKNFQK